MPGHLSIAAFPWKGKKNKKEQPTLKETKTIAMQWDLGRFSSAYASLEVLTLPERKWKFSDAKAK